jgi:hypothetical protein
MAFAICYYIAELLYEFIWKDTMIELALNGDNDFWWQLVSIIFLVALGTYKLAKWFYNLYDDFFD